MLCHSAIHYGPTPPISPQNEISWSPNLGTISIGVLYIGMTWIPHGMGRTVISHVTHQGRSIDIMAWDWNDAWNILVIIEITIGTTLLWQLVQCLDFYSWSIGSEMSIWRKWHCQDQCLAAEAISYAGLCLPQRILRYVFHVISWVCSFEL